MKPGVIAVIAGHRRFLSVMAGARADVGGGAGAGGGFPALAGPVAGDVELVVVQGGGGAPVAGDGAAAGGGGGGAFGAGAFGGALVPPRVVQVGDGVAEPGADGAGVAADEVLDGGLADAEGAGDAGRAVSHDVQGAQPQPGAAGVQAGARDGPVVHGEDGGRGTAGGPAAAAGQVRDGGRGQACGAGDAAVGAAVLAQAADAGPGRAPGRGGTGGRVRRVSWGRTRAGGGVDAHLSSPASAW